MKLPAHTKEQTCKIFGCSMQQLNQQYAANANTLTQMYVKAKTTGRKVNGYTAEQLKILADRFTELSK